ncbi:FAD-binding oxidoreductase [Loktanella sp. IMCC34160]|uniref:NAD(P)/FAD-dependent oxidoreductase n=1 Tax=Loktanella sp. IMCC34160 TaxID=2510646 RepID=UPI00101BCA7E|nr:FAD-binding oxidoreductase [Loktanella sp. IMCC34160]RYG91810.1 FAD-binding oxidoreductase [Loktanella sp. IMCC34160]
MTPFPISETSPIEHGGCLPDSADVVVVGGGVTGVMTAYWLARAGQRVVLAEKGRIAGEQSSRNWGWIRQQGRDPDELPIMVEANRHWRDLAPQLDTDIGLKQGGVLYLGETEKDMADFEGWMPHARARGVDTQVLSRAGLADLLPGARGVWHGGLYTPSDMRAEPWLAVPALARLAAKEGAVIAENCAVRAIDVAAGRVAGVVTEAGRIKAPAVVVAGGAWSRLLLQAHGVQIPQLSVRASVAASDPLPLVADCGVAGSKLAFRRRADGGYTFAPSSFHELFIGPDAFRSLPKFVTQLKGNPFGTSYRPAAPQGYPDAWGTPRRWDADRSSPFEAIRVLNPKPNMGKLFQLKAMFARMYPDLPPVRFHTAWAGMIDTMPDVVPVIDRAESLPGLTIATGMSGHGFGIGPGVGRVVADLVQGNDPGHVLHRFRLSRFSDGSRIDLGPAL